MVEFGEIPSIHSAAEQAEHLVEKCAKEYTVIERIADSIKEAEEVSRLHGMERCAGEVDGEHHQRRD